MNEEEVFHQALALAIPERRAAYLDRACAGDPELRASVEALLRANEGASGFLVGPAPALNLRIDPAVDEQPGRMVGPFKLLEPIGEGGMGVVYMAEQTQPVRRKVALKVIKPGMDTRRVIARFEAERQALALMDHPNIARILDAGATDSGRPYFAMELVRGIPITEFCDRDRLSIADRLELFAQVCQAVQHAHERGIVHRDLKPSNVMITLHDGTPVPKVIDFGIAKATGHQTLTDKTLYTGFAELVGTPMYLSPEQAELSGIDVDNRTDVYALGVLLYELLTGVTPFDQATIRTAALDQVRWIIREQDPPPPSTRYSSLKGTRSAVSGNRQTDPRRLNSLLRGELDWITMKALEKDRRRRYQTAGAFAADITRYRNHEPLEAGPLSAWYRGRKFARRHRLGLMMSAIAALAAALVVATWTWSAARVDRADRDRDQARTEAQRRAIEARHHRYAADIRQTHQLAQNGRGSEALELLHKYLPAEGDADIREFAWYYLMRLCHGERRTFWGHKGPVYHAGFAPDGRTLVSCGQDGTVRLWDVATGRPGRSFLAPGRPDEVNWAEFSPDGRTLVSAGDDGQIRLWNVATGGLAATISAHTGAAYARFTPDGRRLVSAGRTDGLVKLWDISTRLQVKSIQASEQVIESVEFSPDGRTLATAGYDGRVGLWNLSDLSPKERFPTGGAMFDVAFSADGTRIATGNDTGCVRVWDSSTGELRGGFQGQQHNADVQSVAFLAGDRNIVSAGSHAILKLWDAASGTCLGSLLGHSDKIWGISVSPDKTSFVTASSDGTVKLWEPRPPRLDRTVPILTSRGTRTPVAFAFTADGRTLVAAQSLGGASFFPPDGTPGYVVGADLEVSGFDANTGRQTFHHILDRRRATYGPALSPDGTFVAFHFPGLTASTWEAATGKRLATIKETAGLCWARDDLLMVKRQALELVDAATGQSRGVVTGTDNVFAGFLAPAQRDILAVQRSDQLIIWDLAARQVARRRSGGRPVTSGALSPDATILAVADSGAVIRLWKVATLELLGTLPGHSHTIRGLAFSPDGRTLVSDSKDGTVKLWDVAAGEELLTLTEPFNGAVAQVRFAPDGRILAVSTDGEGAIRIHVLATALPGEVDSEEREASALLGLTDQRMSDRMREENAKQHAKP